jgi:hypothetical protein
MQVVTAATFQETVTQTKTVFYQPQTQPQIILEIASGVFQCLAFFFIHRYDNFDRTKEIIGENKRGVWVSSLTHREFNCKALFLWNTLNQSAKLCYPDKTCEAKFLNDKLNGVGTVFFPNHGTLIENFKNGQLEGDVKFANPDGLILWKGEIKENVFYEEICDSPIEDPFKDLNGEMDHSHSQQLAPEGNFNGTREQIPNGYPNGIGKVIYSNGVICEGQFLNGFLHGPGMITVFKNAPQQGISDSELNDSRNIISIAEGLFENGKLNGRGKVTLFLEKQVWKGLFINDKLNGKGKITFSNGEIWKGIFLNGDLNGPGKIIFPDRTTHEGEFVNDELTGQGRIINPDGSVENGTFENGVFIRDPQVAKTQKHRAMVHQEL